MEELEAEEEARKRRKRDSELKREVEEHTVSTNCSIFLVDSDWFLVA